jgi:hypothetical protein
VDEARVPPHVADTATTPQIATSRANSHRQGGGDHVLRNYDQKIKDMAESVLPSTARGRARAARRRAHKGQRARERDALVAVRRVESLDDAGVDVRDGRRAREISQLVWIRRGADKTGSLARWAGARVDRDPRLRTAPLAEQVGHVARLMPDSLIGRHAVQHVESALRHRGHREDWRPRWNAEKAQEEREALARDPREVFARGPHAELNASLRAGYLARATRDGSRLLPSPGRLLIGGHEVDEFATAAAGQPWIRETARQTLAHPAE